MKDLLGINSKQRIEETGDNMKKFFINVQGGTGMNIALASFISFIKENGDAKGNKDYSFTVLSPYFDIFESCKDVERVYKPNEIRDFIFDAEFEKAELVMGRLYDLDGFIKKQMSYPDAWAKMLNIPWKKDKEAGTVTTSNLEPEKKYPYLGNQANEIVKTIKEKGYKDFVIMQFTGGQSPLVQVPQSTDKDGKVFADWNKVPYNYDNEPLKRHYPIDLVNKFIELFRNAHPETAVILYQLPNEPAPENVFRFTVPYLAYHVLARKDECTGVVSIDSSLQHLVAGLTKTVVIWGHSLPLSFGYDYNKNILQDCRRDDILYFSALGPSGAAIRYIKPEDLLKEVDAYLFGEEK